MTPLPAGGRTFHPFLPSTGRIWHYEPFKSLNVGFCCFAPAGIFGESQRVLSLQNEVENMKREMARRSRVAEKRLERVEAQLSGGQRYIGDSVVIADREKYEKARAGLWGPGRRCS